MIPALTAQDEPFFHQRSTHNLIDEIATMSDVTIYVGAGASIERTGLTWAGLSAELLDKDLGDYATRISIVRAQSELAASSAIAQQFITGHGDSSRYALSNAIAELFYGDSRTEPSYFNERVVALANDFISQGANVAIVTPNYDDFLIDAVLRARASKNAAFTTFKTVVFGVAANGVATPRAEGFSELNKSLNTKDELVIVHLHGLVPRNAAPESPLGQLSIPRDIYPVFSERDYSVTRSSSERVLKKLFTNRDLIVVGSSLSDPPLLNALSSSKGRGVRRRFAIRPLQGLDLTRLNDHDFESFRTLEDDRARLLGVKLITPPFFYQAPQILEEARVAIALHEPNEDVRPRAYAELGSTPRYGTRLTDWWDSWREDSEHPLELMQVFSHAFLAGVVLPTLRKVLGSPDEEDLRVEAWMRWEPERRELRLWASSSGSWPDVDLARRDQIKMGGHYLATDAFLNGSPTYATGQGTDTRWYSYLSRPVRYMDPRYKSSIPVGVISVASMQPQSSSSLNPRNKDKSGDLFRVLEAAGVVLFWPENKRVLHRAIENDGFDMDLGY